MESKKAMASLVEERSLLGGPVSPLQAGPVNSNSNSRRTSLSSSSSVFSADSTSPGASCVTRETSQDDCARHRFIVWAAIKRNSCHRMTAADKLECPLLRCRRRFSDHESMLRHLADCEHLPSGEYWCYEHMRPERFDDLKCRRCLGHPSKRRKMLSMAKSFFHSLGHKSKKQMAFDFECGPDDLPPPSYDSLSAGPSGVDAELSSTEICEIDSREVTHLPAAASDRSINPQALLIPELDSTADFYSEEEMEIASAKPMLQLTTQALEHSRTTVRAPPRPASTASRGKGLSPSSSVRSTASTNSNATTTSNVSSLVSPSSAWSGVWSLGSSAPTEMNFADEIFATDASLAEQCLDPNAGTPQGSYSLGTLSELPADLPSIGPDLDLSTDGLFFSFDAAIPATMSYDADLVLTEDFADTLETGQTDVQQSDICCSDTKTMVASTWDALEEHVGCSTSKTQHLSQNPLAVKLRSHSTKSTAVKGLRALRALLNGSSPTSADELVCLIHLIYGFSLVLHEDEANTRSSRLFLQALAYRSHVLPEERDSYTQLVLEIWQPTGIPQAAVEDYISQLPRFPARLKGKQPESDMRTLDLRMDDAILSTARNFLNELEISLVTSEMPSAIDILTSDLYSKHLQDFSFSEAMSALTTTVTYVVSMLKHHFPGIPTLIERLNGIHQSVSRGNIASVRRVELELLHAAKGCMAPGAYFDKFSPAVRQLCGLMYQQIQHGTSRRDAYNMLGISLIEGLLSQFERPRIRRRAVPAPPPEQGDLENLDGMFEDQPCLPLDTDAMAQFVNTDGLIDFPVACEMKLAEEEQHAITPAGSCQPDGGAQQYHQVPEAGPSEQTWALQAAVATDQCSSQQQQQQQPENANKTEANSCCELCGYRPKGDPQWFKGSMAKHKKLQHSASPPKIYKCPFPGCQSAYKNRPDNLRQHQIEKDHFVGGEKGEASSSSRRPSKRKKIAEE